MIKQREGYATDHYVEGDLLEKNELRTLHDGAKVIDFKLRNLRDYVIRKNADYPKQRFMTKHEDYHCVAWKERAEEVDMLFQNGDKIWVRGYMQWNNRYKHQEFVVDQCGRL